GRWEARNGGKRGKGGRHRATATVGGAVAAAVVGRPMFRLNLGEGPAAGVAGMGGCIPAKTEGCKASAAGPRIPRRILDRQSKSCLERFLQLRQKSGLLSALPARGRNL